MKVGLKLPWHVLAALLFQEPDGDGAYGPFKARTAFPPSLEGEVLVTRAMKKKKKKHWPEGKATPEESQRY